VLLQNSDLFWKPTLALQSDVASVITSLAEGLQGYKCDDDWLVELRARDDSREATNRWHTQSWVMIDDWLT